MLCQGSIQNLSRTCLDRLGWPQEVDDQEEYRNTKKGWEKAQKAAKFMFNGKDQDGRYPLLLRHRHAGQRIQKIRTRAEIQKENEERHKRQPISHLMGGTRTGGSLPLPAQKLKWLSREGRLSVLSMKPGRTLKKGPKESYIRVWWNGKVCYVSLLPTRKRPDWHQKTDDQKLCRNLKRGCRKAQRAAHFMFDGIDHDRRFPLLAQKLKIWLEKGDNQDWQPSSHLMGGTRMGDSQFCPDTDLTGCSRQTSRTGAETQDEAEKRPKRQFCLAFNWQDQEGGSLFLPRLKHEWPQVADKQFRHWN